MIHEGECVGCAQSVFEICLVVNESTIGCFLAAAVTADGVVGGMMTMGYVFLSGRRRVGVSPSYAPVSSGTSFTELTRSLSAISRRTGSGAVDGALEAFWCGDPTMVRKDALLCYGSRRDSFINPRAAALSLLRSLFRHFLSRFDAADGGRSSILVGSQRKGRGGFNVCMAVCILV